MRVVRAIAYVARLSSRREPDSERMGFPGHATGDGLRRCSHVGTGTDTGIKALSPRDDLTLLLLLVNLPWV